MKGMSKTGKWLYLYCPRMGWHRGFKRRIWIDDEGNEWIDMRGATSVEWATDMADWYQVERG